MAVCLAAVAMAATRTEIGGIYLTHAPGDGRRMGLTGPGPDAIAG
jgi:hypothetical protein